MLTQRTVERAEPPASGQRFLRDAKVPELALRITAGGARAFVWERRVRGRTRRKTLGRPPAMSLGLARRRAAALSTRVAAGEDPFSLQAQRQQGVTFGELAVRYLADHAKPRKRSWREDARVLRDVVPRAPGDTRALDAAPIPSSWRTRRLADLAREDVAQLHTRLGASGTYQANRVLALLRLMFALARTWGLITGDNPAVGIKPYREQARDRFLSPDELQRVLTALAGEPDPRWRAFFVLSLLLGPRKGELLSAKWEDVDLVGRLWRLPETKAGRSHLLPLPEAAVGILEALPRFKDSPWVFHSATSRSGHLEEPKRAWAKLLTRAQVTGVRIHDLRRTVGSWLAASGHSLPLIGRVLGHSQPAATAVYARLDLAPIREALEAQARRMLPGPPSPGPEPARAPGVRRRREPGGTRRRRT
jgi:integrase